MNRRARGGTGRESIAALEETPVREFHPSPSGHDPLADSTIALILCHPCANSAAIRRARLRALRDLRQRREASP
jgi:hypothetical protein